MNKSISSKGFTRFTSDIIRKNLDSGNRNFGSYLGEVVENVGDWVLRVYIRDISLPEPPDFNDAENVDVKNTYTCEPGFAAIGSDAQTGAKPGQSTSYGLFGPEPQPGDIVIVQFVNGMMPFWTNCVRKAGTGNTTPGASRHQTDASCATVPTTEGSNGEPGETNFILSDNLKKAGLEKDAVRGAGTSHMNRESPSKVTGMKSRGNPTEGEIGHQFTMDDLPEESGIRIRTSHGHQILFSDASQSIYINTAEGNNWIEMHQNGKIDIYSADDISVNTKGNLNLKVEKDFNLEVGGNWNASVAKNMVHNIAGSASVGIGSFYKSNVGGAYDLNVVGNYAMGMANLNILSGGFTKISSSGAAHMRASVINLDGSSRTNIDTGTAVAAEAPSVLALGGGSPVAAVSSMNDVAASGEVAQAEAAAIAEEHTIALNNTISSVETIPGIEKISPEAVEAFTQNASTIAPNFEESVPALSSSLNSTLSSVSTTPINSIKSIVNTNLTSLTPTATGLLSNLSSQLGDNFGTLPPNVNTILGSLNTKLGGYATGINGNVNSILEDNSRLSDVDDFNGMVRAASVEPGLLIGQEIQKLRMELEHQLLKGLHDSIDLPPGLHNALNDIDSFTISALDQVAQTITDSISGTLKDVSPNVKSLIAGGVSAFSSGLGAGLSGQKNSMMGAIAGLSAAAGSNPVAQKAVAAITDKVNSIFEKTESSVGKTVENLNKGAVEGIGPSNKETGLVTREPGPEPFETPERTVVSVCDRPTGQTGSNKGSSVAGAGAEANALQRAIIFCTMTTTFKKMSIAELNSQNPGGAICLINRDGSVDYNSVFTKKISSSKPTDKFDLLFYLAGGKNQAGKYETNFSDTQIKTLKDEINKVKRTYSKIGVMGQNDIQSSNMHPTFYGNYWWKTGEVVSFVNSDANEDEKYLALTLLLEAGNEPELGILEVGHVIMNRKRLRRSSIRREVLATKQFSCYNVTPLSASSAESAQRQFNVLYAQRGRATNSSYMRCLNLAKGLLSGKYKSVNRPDTYHYLNVRTTKSYYKGGVIPYNHWYNVAARAGRTKVIGQHTFCYGVAL